MQIFHYHPVTGVLTGESTADPDPAELDAARVNVYGPLAHAARQAHDAAVADGANPDSAAAALAAALAAAEAAALEVEPSAWLIPGFATAEAPPPAGPGQTAVFADGAWTLVDDPVEPEAPTPPQPTLAERRTLAVDQIRGEAMRRILAIAELWRQSNDNAALARLCWRAPETLTSSEQGELDAAEGRRTAIDAIRAASDALEAAVPGIATHAAMDAFDPADDAHWPASD